VNIADVCLILFYTQRKKCLITWIWNDAFETLYILVTANLWYALDTHKRCWCFQLASLLVYFPPSCALRCTLRKPRVLVNHGGFGTRPPTNVR
jgi:hypothetical protein